MTSVKPPSAPPEGLPNRDGSDPLIRTMIQFNIRPTLTNYLSLAWPERDFATDPLDAEEASMLPYGELLEG